MPGPSRSFISVHFVCSSSHQLADWNRSYCSAQRGSALTLSRLKMHRQAFYWHKITNHSCCCFCRATWQTPTHVNASVGGPNRTGRCTFIRTDSESFSLFTIFMATFCPVMQWTPSFTRPERQTEGEQEGSKMSWIIQKFLLFFFWQCHKRCSNKSHSFRKTFSTCH